MGLSIISHIFDRLRRRFSEFTLSDSGGVVTIVSFGRISRSLPIWSFEIKLFVVIPTTSMKTKFTQLKHKKNKVQGVFCFFFFCMRVKSRVKNTLIF